jgi:hypothetical protein
MQRKSKTIKTTTSDDVRKVTQEIGDSLATTYYATKDLKVVQLSLKAYNTALNAAKAQLIYKKLTGEPSEIDFLK